MKVASALEGVKMRRYHAGARCVGNKEKIMGRTNMREIPQLILPATAGCRSHHMVYHKSTAEVFS